ncbi:hypothetical protein HOLleu_32162 [Holothuria leucospilota]|uniref:Uncharacterized protein n=1 Tax=Holothuria leucospilota TaxID=206669 RepID=A0A9Q0YRF4_HOLLE|nr:hypothetical protein HOLleu_32162 [Holothuria leucospilota]
MDNQLRSEVEGAFIRSRIKYLKDGEKPSAFFFRQESRRSSKKIIQSVRNDSGDIVTSDNDISYVFHNFYSNLFSREHHVNHNLQNDFIQCLKQIVDPIIDREDLDRPITLEEVIAALVSASNNKSPEINDIPYEFYRKFFNVIDNDLTNVYNKIFPVGALSVSQRTALISLIPQKGDLENPKNWRPVSLFNTDYKLLTSLAG